MIPTPEAPDDDVSSGSVAGPRPARDSERAKAESALTQTVPSDDETPQETVTRLGRENAELRRLLAEAGRLAEFGRYAAKLNHELRQPLFAIKGLAQLLLDKNDARDPEETREFASSIVEQADRLGHLVTQLRALSLPSRGGDNQATPTADVAEVVKKVRDFLAARLKKAFTLSVTVDPSLPRVSITEDALQQILINLLTNALDAVESGGAIHLRARQISLPSGAAEGASDGAQDRAQDASSPLRPKDLPAVEIAVGDDGAGIAPSVRDHLFEPFFSTKPAGAGTGLGLVVSRDLARAAGGELNADFSAGASASRFATLAKTVFVLTLPAGRSSDDGRATL